MTAVSAKRPTKAQEAARRILIDAALQPFVGSDGVPMLRSAAGRLVGWREVRDYSLYQCASVVADAGWDWPTVCRINS